MPRNVKKAMDIHLNTETILAEKPKEPAAGKIQSKGLGKGLGALGLGSSLKREGASKRETEIDVDLIDSNPYQPRKTFSEDALTTLMESIKRYGVVQPIVVRKLGDRYQLVAGERRWRASRELGLEKIPAVVKDYSTEEVTEIALVENLQRQDLDPVEEAYAYKKLMTTFKQTQEVIASRLGRSRSHVANMVRLLQLPEFLQYELSAGDITIGQVRPLLTLKTEKLQQEALHRIKEQELNARQVETLVKQLNNGKSKNKPKVTVPQTAELRSVIEQLKTHLGASVNIKLKAGKHVRGKIEIDFTSEEEFNRILSTMEVEIP